MTDKKAIPMRQKILKTSAKLFSERGYKDVTIKDIAEAVGVRVASVYYHFPAKNDITRTLYKHYANQRIKASPDLSELMELAETASPQEVLMKAEPNYDQDIREYLEQILVAAVRSVGVDPEAEWFIQENVFDATSAILKPLLERMVMLGKIKPLDIDAFINVLICYRFGAASIRKTSLENTNAHHQVGLPLVMFLLHD